GIARKPFFGAKTAGSQFFCCKYKTRSLPYYSKQGISTSSMTAQTGSMTILTRLDDRTNRLNSRTYQIFGRANKGTAGIGGARNALPKAMEPRGGTPQSPWQKKEPQEKSENLQGKTPFAPPKFPQKALNFYLKSLILVTEIYVNR
ncbi:MAG: hypothetical protein IIT73_01670, partial [Treponema sp.]|nr:hypothetical protein [Treponema sp.]